MLIYTRWKQKRASLFLQTDSFQEVLYHNLEEYNKEIIPLMEDKEE